MADVSIRGTRVIGVATKYAVDGACLTLDVPIKDQNGVFMGNESVSIELDDPNQTKIFTSVQLTKVKDVILAILKAANKIN